MKKYRFGHLEISPALNPAVLDTCTWDPEAVRAAVQGEEPGYWASLQAAAAQGARELPRGRLWSPSAESATRRAGRTWLLAQLEDGQCCLLGLGTRAGDRTELGSPVARRPCGSELELSVHAADAPTVHRFFREVSGARGPKALGAVPRLGIGCRMSTAVWPGVWPALAARGLAANAIQNSLRELNLLEELRRGEAPHKNVLFSFGEIEEGHTGSTYEGLWLAGVLAALRAPSEPRYGADADHVQVKRGSGGLDRAKRVVEAARYYSFYTLDVSDVLDYGALTEPRPAGRHLESLLKPAERSELLAAHRRARRFGDSPYEPGEEELDRLVGKYWTALDAVEQLVAHLRTLKGEEPFDLELSIDENPPTVKTCDCITRPSELVFLILECRRRGIPVTHLAPNFGVEKGVDYRCPGGLEELGGRVESLHRICSEQGLMLDCHSGDDLSAATRKVFGRSTGGEIHFKISPNLQELFAWTMHEVQPEAFRSWWEATREYVQAKAEEGSPIAREALQKLAAAGPGAPSPADDFFHKYHFAPVGLRDGRGGFRHRELFYGLAPEFYREYAQRVQRLLLEIADDLFVAA